MNIYDSLDYMQQVNRVDDLYFKCLVIKYDMNTFLEYKKIRNNLKAENLDKLIITKVAIILKENKWD